MRTASHDAGHIPFMEEQSTMSNYLPSKDDQLSGWAANFAAKAPASAATTGLTTTEIKAMGDAQVKLANDIAAHTQAMQTAKSLRATKQASRRAVIQLAQLYNAKIQANPAVTDSIKTNLGLKVRQRAMPVTPQVPASLVVTGYDNGVNALKWKSGGNKPNTAYVVEALYPDAAQWVQVGSVTRLSFEHTGQTPGVQVVYRLRARRRTEFSNPSNTAIAYDTSSVPTLVLQKAA